MLSGGWLVGTWERVVVLVVCCFMRCRSTTKTLATFCTVSGLVFARTCYNTQAHVIIYPFARTCDKTQANVSGLVFARTCDKTRASFCTVS